MDHLTNDPVRSDLKIQIVDHKITQYQNKWKGHLERMDKDRLPRKLLESKSRGYRNQVGPTFQ